MAKPYFLSPDQAMSMNPWGAMMAQPSQAAINETSMDAPMAISAPAPARAPAAVSPYARQAKKTTQDFQSYLDAVNGTAPISEQRARLSALDALNASSVGAINTNQEDLSPILSLIDTYTGSKLSQSYKKPMSNAEKAQMLMAAAGDTQKGHEALLKDVTTQARSMQSDALAEQGKNQGLAKEGYAIDDEGNVSMAPGGMAEAKLAETMAQADQHKAMAKYYRDDKARMSALTHNSAMERQENQIHARLVQRIKTDPAIKQRLNQYTNLTNALNNFENAEHPTAQSFDELQQAVRSNLGIKGSNAVGERERTTMNSLGLDATRMMQFLTANPQDIEKDAGLAKHMKDLVALEQKNIRSQTQRHLNTLSQGHGSMYKRRADLAGDLQDVVGGFQDEFQSFAQPVVHGGGPKAGDIEDGHMFTGGDPADEKNWKVQ